MKDVLDNPDKPWDWYGLSKNPNISMKNVQENPELSWDWIGLSQNAFGWKKDDIHKKMHKECMYQVCAEIEFAPEGTFGLRMSEGGIEWQNQKMIFESI